MKKDDLRKLVEAGYDAGCYEATFRSAVTLKRPEKYFLDKVLEFSLPHPEILDLGSGTGVPIDKYLVERGAKMTGVDFSAKHVTAARMNVPTALFIEDDFSRIEFGEAKFDAVISVYAIFHIPRDEHKTLFHKIHTCLKRRGVFMANLRHFRLRIQRGTRLGRSSYGLEHIRRKDLCQPHQGGELFHFGNAVRRQTRG